MVTMWGERAAVSAINRSYFDETAGEAMVKRLSLRGPLVSEAAGAVVGADKYVALAATHALLRYVEVMQRVTFLPNTIHFVFREPAGRMVRDTCTALRVAAESAAPHRTAAGAGL